jgi:nicotinamide-nucleotide amidase
MSKKHSACDETVFRSYFVSEKSNSAIILAVGSELTSGQVTNRNACWLSQKLEDYGITTIAHLTVPDDRELILKALNQSQDSARYLFVTGGLGPTSDDFTREVVAQYLESPLEFHEDQWQVISDLLKSRGIQMREIQRQQSYFPKNCQVLSNPVGTAAAFSTKYRDQFIWILPGPPRELAAIFEAHIRKQLEVLRAGAIPVYKWIWQCLGQPESIVAEKTESVVADSGLQVGYRVHIPYVEVKLWSDGSKKAADVAALLDLALGSWVTTRQSEDLAQMFCHELSRIDSVLIEDGVTRGFLEARVFEALQALKLEIPLEVRTHFLGSKIETPSKNSPNRFQIREITSTQSELVYNKADFVRVEKVEWLGANRPPEFIRKWTLEVALRTWLSWLKT